MGFAILSTPGPSTMNQREARKNLFSDTQVFSLCGSVPSVTLWCTQPQSSEMTFSTVSTVPAW
jgi:hypothetical protein